jgi:hypothetical protein
MTAKVQGSSNQNFKNKPIKNTNPTASVRKTDSTNKYILELMERFKLMRPEKFLDLIKNVANGNDEKDIAGTSDNGYSPALLTRVREELREFKHHTWVGMLPPGVLQVIRDCPTIGNPPVIDMAQLKKDLKSVQDLENKKPATVAASQIIISPKPVERKDTASSTPPPKSPAPAAIQESKQTTDTPVVAQVSKEDSGKKKEEVSQGRRGNIDFSNLKISKETLGKIKDDMQAINEQTQATLKTAGQANRTQGSGGSGEDDDGGILGSGNASLPLPPSNIPAPTFQGGGGQEKNPAFIKKLQDMLKGIFKLPKR